MALGANYHKLLAAAGIGNLGDGIAMVAYPWLATLITRDPVLIGLFAAISRLPWLVCSLPAGVLADRYDRRWLVAGSSAAQAVLTLLVVLLVLTAAPAGNMTLYGALCLILFLIGAAEVIRDNAAQSLLPLIVDKSALETANGRLWTAETVTNSFLGPPLAGVLIAVALPIPFAVDAATFALAALLVGRIRLPAGPKRSHSPMLPAIREGFAWLWQRHFFRRLALCLGLMNMLHTMGLAILVLYAQDVMGLDAGAYGILLTGGAAGAVIGGLLAPKVIARVGAAVSIHSALALMAASYFAYVIAPVPGIIWLTILVEAYAAMQWNIVTVSLRQRTIPDAILGRVNAVYRFFGWGMIPLGSLLGGILVAMAAYLLDREVALRLPFLVAGLSNGVLLWRGRAWFSATAIARAEAAA